MKNASCISMLLVSSFTLFTACNCKDDSTGPNPDCARQGDSLVIYINSNNISSGWFPSGWMGNFDGLTYQDDFAANPHSAPECIKINFTTPPGWVGIYWLPSGSWAGPGLNVTDKLKLCDSKSVKVEFWARGEQGGEKVQFFVGGVADGHDSIDPAEKTPWYTLSTDWARYEIDLSGLDLSNIVGGFGWVTAFDENPGMAKINFFLDDIKYVVQ